MPQELTWNDSEEIGIQLQEKHPEIDPVDCSVHGSASLCDGIARIRR